MININQINTLYTPSLVFDASALINIIDSGYAETILKALATPCLFEGFVLNEVAVFKSRKSEIDKLCRKGLLILVDMTEDESIFFLTLIMPPPLDALHDGEAATLSVAKYRGGIAVIDEKKAIRIAVEKKPPIKTCATADLLSSPSVGLALGVNRLNQAVFNALTIARMRIPINREEWVLNQLTDKQILQCPSVRRKAKQGLMKGALPGN